MVEIYTRCLKRPKSVDEIAHTIRTTAKRTVYTDSQLAEPPRLLTATSSRASACSSAPHCLIDSSATRDSVRKDPTRGSRRCGRRRIQELVARDALDDVAVFQAFFALTDRLWMHWLYELTLNFTSNTGFDAERTLILIDFGEITAQREHVVSELESRRWKQSWTYRFDLPAEVRETYAELAEQQLTTDRLDLLWGTAER